MNFKEFKTYIKLMEISLSAISTYFYFKKKTFQRKKKNLILTDITHLMSQFL